MPDEVTPMFLGAASADLEPTAVDTRVCDVCSEEFATEGKSTASFLLGRHRWQKHQIKGDGSKSKAKTPKQAAGVTDDDFAAQPVLSIVRDAADSVTGRGAPSAEALSRGLGRAVHLGTLAGASYVIESDPNIPEGQQGDALRDLYIGQMSLSEKSAQALFRPLAKPIAGTKFNKKYGRDIIENVDAIAAISEVAILAGAWRRYFRERNQFNAMHAPAPQPFTAVPMEPAQIMQEQAPIPGADLPLGLQPQPNPAMDGLPTSPAPMNGVVMTPELVRQIRERNDRAGNN